MNQTQVAGENYCAGKTTFWLSLLSLKDAVEGIQWRGLQPAGFSPATLNPAG
jgi:hypothetical protein